MTDDKINHPGHYGGDVPFEAIKLIEDWGFGFGFCMGSAVKYTVRAGAKEGESTERDMGKAIWYLERAQNQASAPEPPPRFFRLSPHKAADYHGLNGDRARALEVMAQRDPAAAVRFLMGQR